MRYCQHRAVFKLRPNCHLDKIIRLEIDCCCRFVEDQDSRLAKQRSRQTDELSLANAANKDRTGLSPRSPHCSEPLVLEQMTHQVKLPSKKKVVFSKQPSLSAPELINPCCSVAQLVVASVCLWPDPVLTDPPNALFPSLRQEPGN